MVLGLTLRKLGHEVEEAANGQEAWEASQREHFPLILSDWMMPGLDGLALTRMVRDRQSRYSYVLLRASTPPGATEWLESGDRLVSPGKSWPASRLATRLEKCANASSTLAQSASLRRGTQIFGGWATLH